MKEIKRKVGKLRLNVYKREWRITLLCERKKESEIDKEKLRIVRELSKEGKSFFNIKGRRYVIRWRKEIKKWVPLYHLER